MSNGQFGAGRLVSALAWDRRVRVLVAVVEGPARELCARHQLGPRASVLAAEGLVASVLFTGQGKGEERFTVHVQGDRPAFTLTVDLHSDGSFRGRFTPAEIAATDGGRDVEGVMAVLKYLGDEELYRGVAPVEGERFERAMARFLTQSVQVDGRVRIEAQLDDEGVIRSASGLLLERMPDLSPEEFSAVFDGALQDDLPGLMTSFAFGQLAGHPVEVLEARDLVYHCPCSRERVLSMLSATGADELREMIEEDGGSEVTCEFCNERYDITVDELRTLLGRFG